MSITQEILRKIKLFALESAKVLSLTTYLLCNIKYSTVKCSLFIS